MARPAKPVRFYASKSFQVEEDKWTKNPDDLYYYCDIGDTLWRIVTPQIRKQAIPEGRTKKRAAETQKDIENLSDSGSGASPEVHLRTGPKVRRDPGDPAPKRNGP